MQNTQSMMSINWVSALILFFVVIITWILSKKIVGIRKVSKELMLIFASTYLFTLTIVHLIPEIFEKTDFKTSGILLLAGFMLQLFLDYFSGGIEHGHKHHDQSGTHHTKGGMIVVISLCIHAFLEASLLSDAYGSTTHQKHAENTLLLGIILHKLPATLALSSLFTPSKKHNIQRWLACLLFAASAPLGLLSIPLWGKFVNLNYLYALVCGMILHLALVIFFENNRGHKPKTEKIITILIATIIAISSLYL